MKFLSKYGLLISVLINAVFVCYITYLRVQYDRSIQGNTKYQKERDVYSHQLDSVKGQFTTLENELKTAQKKEASWQANYDSLKVEYYKKKNVNTAQNRAILNYDAKSLDEFWSNFTFKHNN